jgi:hypothetical protein
MTDASKLAITDWLPESDGFQPASSPSQADTCRQSCCPVSASNTGLDTGVICESRHFMQPSVRSCQKAWSGACRSMPGLLFARGLHVPTADLMGLHVWQYSCAGLAVYPQPCRQMVIMCAGGLGALYKSAGHLSVPLSFSADLLYRQPSIPTTSSWEAPNGVQDVKIERSFSSHLRVVRAVA